MQTTTNPPPHKQKETLTNMERTCEKLRIKKEELQSQRDQLMISIEKLSSDISSPSSQHAKQTKNILSAKNKETHVQQHLHAEITTLKEKNTQLTQTLHALLCETKHLESQLTSHTIYLSLKNRVEQLQHIKTKLLSANSIDITPNNQPHQKTNPTTQLNFKHGKILFRFEPGTVNTKVTPS